MRFLTLLPILFVLAACSSDGDGNNGSNNDNYYNGYGASLTVNSIYGGTQYDTHSTFSLNEGNNRKRLQCLRYRSFGGDDIEISYTESYDQGQDNFGFSTLNNSSIYILARNSQQLASSGVITVSPGSSDVFIDVRTLDRESLSEVFHQRTRDCTMTINNRDSYNIDVNVTCNGLMNFLDFTNPSRMDFRASCQVFDI